METKEKDTDRKEAIEALYLHLLERGADMPGLHTYVNSTLSIKEIEDDMRKSHEYVILCRQKDFGKQVESLGSGERLLMGSSPKTEENVALLKSSGINTILNLDSPFEGKVDLSWCTRYLNVSLNNDVSIDTEKLEMILDFIYTSLSLSDTRLFIHSSRGLSRAPMVIALFLMADKKIRLYDALQLVLSKHRMVNPSRALVSAEVLTFVKNYKHRGTVLKNVPLSTPTVFDKASKSLGMVSVTDTVFVGKDITTQLAATLKAAKIDVVIDINEDKKKIDSAAQWFSHIHLPIPDKHINEMLPVVIRNVKRYSSKGRLIVVGESIPKLVMFVENYVSNLGTEARMAVDIGDLRRRLMSM